MVRHVWKLAFALFLIIPGFIVSAQVTIYKYDSGFTYRQVALDPAPGTDSCGSAMCTYHKMQTWGNASPIKEFTYRGMDNNLNLVEFMNWRMLFPVGYDKTRAEKYPMIVMLHGSGESGRLWSNNFDYAPTDPRYDNNDANITIGGKVHQIAAGWSHVTAAPLGTITFPGIVIWPQVSYNGGWEGGWNNGVLGDETRKVVQIIEWIIDKYDIDPDRISIHGLSNGAQGVWDIAAKRPDLFAAILPMSGLPSDEEKITDVLVTSPMWVFQGGKDTNPAPQATTDVLNLIKAKGGKPIYTEYANLSHECWDAAFAEPNFFPFILKANKKDIFLFCDSICDQLPVKMGVSGGYAAYQWMRNGADIPSANTRFYTATKNGRYEVRMTSQPRPGGGGGTARTSNPVTIGVTTGIDDEPTVKVNAYPNPFHDRVMLTLPGNFDGGQAVLISPLGLNVNTQNIPGDSNTVSLDYSNVEPGAYFLSVGQYKLKVVKVN